MKNRTNEYYTVDLTHIAKMLLQRMWIIILVGILAAAIGFSLISFVITPKYSASVKLYVNNSSFSKGETSISTSEITAAQKLVSTYGEILNSRMTLEMIIEEADVSYTPSQLSGMIKSEPANDTEIMVVTVTSEDPYEAALIANSVAIVLPVRIAQIIEGTSMEVVDSAKPHLAPVGLGVPTFTALCALIGVLAAVVVLSIFALLDDAIHDEDYVLQNYECPVLAKIPDLINIENDSHYGYYKSRSKR